jgi:hypothetical protein
MGLDRAIKLVKQYGARRLLLRLDHARKLRTGAYRSRLPAKPWPEPPSEYALIPVFPPLPANAQPRREPDKTQSEPSLYFGWMPKAREPEDWHRDPRVEGKYPLGHWSNLPLFAQPKADVKWAWEPGRFQLVFELGLHYASSGEEEWKDVFLDLVREFKEHNPPQLGVQWTCAQETSYRLIATLWGAGVFHQALTDSELRELGAFAEVHAERVYATLGYARAQQNNHALIESAALCLAAWALPSHPLSTKWEKAGSEMFVEQVRRQFSSESGYAMRSSGYMRSALTDVMLLVASARYLGKSQVGSVPLEDIGAMTRAALDGAAAAVDKETGASPNLGLSDGSWYFNPTQAPILDFRPHLQAASVVLRRERIFPNGPWNDLAEHLEDGPVETLELTEPDLNRADRQGVSVLQAGDWRVVVRGAKPPSSATDADLLHADVYYGGHPVALDGGSFQYNGDRHWFNLLRATTAHNTLALNGESQMRNASQWVWENLPEAGHQVDQDRRNGKFWHDGYVDRFGYRHVRTVEVSEKGVELVDSLEPVSRERETVATVGWRLDAVNWQGDRRNRVQSQELGVKVSVTSDPPVDLQRAAEDQLPGLTKHAPYYGKLQPANGVFVQVPASSTLKVRTEFRAIEELEA